MGTISIDHLTLGFYQVNTYFLTDKDTKETIIVDPGSDGSEIYHYLKKNSLNPVLIINTHGHPDHVEANRFLKEQYQIPIATHREDMEMFNIEADKSLDNGEIIELNQHRLRIIHTPGHTMGGICLQGDGFLLTGDTIFAGAMGRTDIGGDEDVMMETLRTRFDGIPGETILYPGHGPDTTMKEERDSNPYILLAKSLV
jgi:hydroxyacylglutathione hydrolase